MIFVVKLFRFKMFLHFYKTGIQKLKNYNLGHMLVDICEIWQKALVRELAKSAYFRSASSESDNK